MVFAQLLFPLLQVHKVCVRLLSKQNTSEESAPDLLRNLKLYAPPLRLSHLPDVLLTLYQSYPVYLLQFPTEELPHKSLFYLSAIHKALSLFQGRPEARLLLQGQVFLYDRFFSVLKFHEALPLHHEKYNPFLCIH